MWVWMIWMVIKWFCVLSSVGWSNESRYFGHDKADWKPPTKFCNRLLAQLSGAWWSSPSPSFLLHFLQRLQWPPTKVEYSKQIQIHLRFLIKKSAPGLEKHWEWKIGHFWPVPGLNWNTENGSFQNTKSRPTCGPWRNFFKASSARLYGCGPRTAKGCLSNKSEPCRIKLL